MFGISATSSSWAGEELHFAGGGEGVREFPSSSSVSGDTRGSPNTNHNMSLNSSGSFRDEELAPFVPDAGGRGKCRNSPLEWEGAFLPSLSYPLPCPSRLHSGINNEGEVERRVKLEQVLQLVGEDPWDPH